MSEGIGMTDNAHRAVQYLQLIGRLHADNHLVLRPGYLTERPLPSQATDPTTLFAEIRSQDRPLVRAPLAVFGYCGRSDSALAVRGTVPLPDAADNMRIVRSERDRDDVVIADIEVPSTGPELEIIDVPRGAVTGSHLIRWRAAGEPPPTEFRIRYSHDDGRAWIPVLLRTTSLSASVDVDDLPGGDRCKVAVVATNGVRSTTVQSEPFQVPVKPCRPLIQKPSSDAELSTEEVELLGNGWWLEESTPELDQLSWRSDVDGELGRGRLLRARLSPGRHVLTLTAGAGERAGSSSVIVQISPQPQPWINRSAAT